MEPNFFHILLRIVYGMPTLVSSNWAAWGLGFLLFLLYEGAVLYRRGWQDMKERWTENFIMGIIVTIVGYVFLFTWSTVRTIYDDHHDSTARWQTVVREKDNLKAELGIRDKYIKDLEAKSCPICSTNRRPQPQALTPLPQTFKVQEINAFVEPEDSSHADAPYAAKVTLQANTAIDPLFLNIRCADEIKYVTLTFADPQNAHMWYGNIEPAAQDHSVVIVHMSGSGKTPISPDSPVILHLSATKPIIVKQVVRLDR
jgi:hypothetical protein